MAEFYPVIEIMHPNVTPMTGTLGCQSFDRPVMVAISGVDFSTKKSTMVDLFLTVGQTKHVIEKLQRLLEMIQASEPEAPNNRIHLLQEEE
jgi:hypothetical protein